MASGVGVSRILSFEIEGKERKEVPSGGQRTPTINDGVYARLPMQVA